MNTLVIVACGGAFGAVLRYFFSNAVYASLGRTFPYGTLSVNVIGSFFIGIFFVLLAEKMTFGADARTFIMIGLLGAFTTFSTFSLETLLLIQQGQLLKALINILVSVLLCLLATWMGITLARSV